jgi:hypothetical protein
MQAIHIGRVRPSLRSLLTAHGLSVSSPGMIWAGGGIRAFSERFESNVISLAILIASRMGESSVGSDPEGSGGWTCRAARYRVCREFRVGEMAVSPNRLNATISVLIEVSPRCSRFRHPRR